jgi:proliferating cell nuclear antigen
MNLKSLEKILKCCQADDSVTIKAQDDGDVISFKFVSKNEERVSEFDMNLMNIDQEHLAIPVSSRSIAFNLI